MSFNGVISPTVVVICYNRRDNSKYRFIWLLWMVFFCWFSPSFWIKINWWCHWVHMFGTYTCLFSLILYAYTDSIVFRCWFYYYLVIFLEIPEVPNADPKDYLISSILDFIPSITFLDIFGLYILFCYPEEW